MALPATDDFNRADGGLGANWTNQFVDLLRIVSQSVQAASGGSVNCQAFWNADVFGNDQYSQCVFTTVSAHAGLCVRASGTPAAAAQGYVWLANLGTVYKLVSGTYTSIASGFSTPSDGNTIKLTVVGTTITCYTNGVSVGTVTDATHASGSAGLYANNGGGGFPTLDAWEGGNVSAGGATNWGPSMLSQGWNRIVLP